MKRYTIDPITRLEGHGKIEIFVDDNYQVKRAYLQVPEFRGFEKFCVGRPVEEMPRITCRICGVCPPAHHTASTKAADAVYKVEIPPLAKKLRELAYSAYYFSDHTLHIYALGGPDFVLGPKAPKAQRNILGVIQKVGLEVGKEVIKNRGYGQRILTIFGGKGVHPIYGVPGGISKGLTKEERDEIIAMSDSMLEFAKFTQKLIEDVVLKNKEYMDIILAEENTMPTYYAGLVDENNYVNFYDGKVRVVDQEGKEFAKFTPPEYLNHIAERTEQWSYLKFPYLKNVGWKGFSAGKDSGIYRVAPLARLNVADGMATPLAQAEYEKMYDTLGGKPAHQTFAYHWARAIEQLYAAELLHKLIREDDITGDEIRVVPTETPSEGVGIVEACRGTLIHHYKTDENGIITDVNLIVATVQNNAAMCMSLTDMARYIMDGKKRDFDEGDLNMIEMAFRAYDPCMACGTHSLPGEMPLEVNIRSWDTGDILKSITRGLD
ncbi:MAG: Ni/Fe hydrogenase subunit alpha [Candidatus Coatesbacteria bacterium]|nr:MAG: Ni/Fe hydrogenase subunit alpha [Candidatus Coatesbacteria bacterium]